jgi:hypothetical protein
VELCVDAKTVARELLHPGNFELRGDVPPASASVANSIHSLELKFSHFQHLPNNSGYPDGRPVAARLQYVGLRPASSTAVARGENR